MDGSRSRPVICRAIRSVGQQPENSSITGLASSASAIRRCRLLAVAVPDGQLDVLADADVGDPVEPERRQGPLDRLALRVEDLPSASSTATRGIWEPPLTVAAIVSVPGSPRLPWRDWYADRA